MGAGIWPSITAEIGVRSKSKVVSGVAGKGGARAAPGAKVVPWTDPHHGFKLSEDYAINTCKVGVLPAPGLLGP